MTTKDKDPLKGLSLDFLSECFDIEDDRTLRWKSIRPSSHFGTQQGCSMWHTRYSSGYPSATTPRGYKYVDIYVEGERHRLYQHIIIFSLLKGSVPKEHLHFLDGDPGNTHVDNLVEATLSQIQGSKRTTNKVARGVFTKSSGSGVFEGYAANIRIDGTTRHLGTYPTIEEAHRVYTEAAEEYFGTFANHLNPKKEK